MNVWFVVVLRCIFVEIGFAPAAVVSFTAALFRNRVFAIHVSTSDATTCLRMQSCRSPPLWTSQLTWLSWQNWRRAWDWPTRRRFPRMTPAWSRVAVSLVLWLLHCDLSFLHLWLLLWRMIQPYILCMQSINRMRYNLRGQFVIWREHLAYHRL